MADLTDSGGVQKAPGLASCAGPRETTERPEAVAQGTCLGDGRGRHRQERHRLRDPAAYRLGRRTNPYGDGARSRIVAALEQLLLARQSLPLSRAA